MDELEGKVAVVTGAASGIGLALARRFATEGMQVVLADVAAEPLEAAAKSLGDEFGADGIASVVTDVRDPAAVDNLAAATFERFGTAHVVCNNAGVAVGGLSWTVPPDRWRWIIEVNLLGVVNGIRSFVPRLIEQGEGHVVNTASVAGFLSAPAMGPYMATKHAVVALTECLHFELQISGGQVGASVLCPEWVRTQIANSERNRPEGVTPMEEADAPEADGARSFVQGLVESGIDPAEVAAKVVEAIGSGRFWIFTHPTSLPSARKRWQAIEDDGQPQWWGG